MTLIQEFPQGKSFNLTKFLPVQAGAGAAATIFHRDDLTIYVRSLDAEQTFGRHQVPAEAIVQVIFGSADIKINDVPNTVKMGEAIVIPANATHSVTALEPAGFYVVVVYPSKS